MTKKLNKASLDFYRNHYPSLNVDENGLTKEQAAAVILLNVKDVNPESDLLDRFLDSTPYQFLGQTRLVRMFMEFINPGGQPRGSNTSTVYWLRRGWNLREASERVSALQRAKSKRCIEFWLSKGYSDVEAARQVSKVQREASLKVKTPPRQRSIWCEEYWLRRGLSKEDAAIEVSRIQTENNAKAQVKMASIPEYERKATHPCNIEYWETNYGTEDYVKLFEDYLAVRYSNAAFRSKKADLFCQEVAKHFGGEKLYYGENEYGKYIPSVGYRKWDFVNTTRNFVIEFHGNHWHEVGSVRDAIKEEFMVNSGFKYYVIWENDYDEDPETAISNLVEKIRNENSTISKTSW